MAESYGELAKSIEFSKDNTLSQDRKDLHRNVTIPLMDREMEEIKKTIVRAEKTLRDLGYDNPDEVDVDNILGENFK